MPHTIVRTGYGSFVCTACGEPASSADIEWDECSICGGESFAGDDDDGKPE